MKRVWVVEAGSYEQRGAVAVYRTLEAVIANNPPRTRRGKPVGEWCPWNPAKPDQCVWDNGMDGEEYLTATPMEVLDAPPAPAEEGK
jgi:hypothetical protein